jgi:hypothetical protein
MALYRGRRAPALHRVFIIIDSSNASHYTHRPTKFLRKKERKENNKRKKNYSSSFL